MNKRVFMAVVMISAQSVMAQQTGVEGDGRFKWSWETGAPERNSVSGKPAPGAVDAAIYDKTVNENLKLRRELEDARKSADEARKSTPERIKR
mgnify:CR=1 FL=1